MPTIARGATGVPAAWKLPGIYTEVVLGASPNGAGGAPRSILILAGKVAAAPAKADVEVLGPLTVDLAAERAGEGSELALGVAAALTLEPTASVYAIAVAEPVGGKASARITVAGIATAGGDVVLKIHRVTLRVGVLVGQAAATIAANIGAAINGAADRLCVAASVTGAVVTVSYRHAGTRGNLVKVYVTPESSIAGASFTLSSPTLLGGTGTDNLDAALRTAATRRFDVYALAQVDSANLALAQTRLRASAGPLVRLRSQAVAWNSDTQGTATALAQSLNEARVQVCWHKRGEDLSVVGASAWAARRAVLEADEPNVNLSRFNPEAVDLSPVIGPPSNDADYPSETEANAALDAGLTAIVIRQHDRHAMVALSITTHSQDTFGNPDARILTTNMVTVTDAWAAEVETYVPSAFPGMYLRDDPQEGDDPLPPRTLTPSVLKGHLVERCDRLFAKRGWIRTFDEDAKKWVFNVDPSNENRCNAAMEIHPTPWFTQFSSQIRQLSGTAS